MRNLKESIGLICLIFILNACASQKSLIPPGQVPRAQESSAADEGYGHEVLGQLTNKYAISRDDLAIARVRKIVDALANAAGGSQHPWHVYVLEGDQVVNAAATRGNHIFVWTGLLKLVDNDNELATVLAHEIAHILAGHTNPNPSEQAREILAAVLGQAAGVAAGPYAPSIASSIVHGVVSGFIVNPQSKATETEADTIGLYLMADAGFDPESAIHFWRKIDKLPEAGISSLQFFSTHPSADDRIANLQMNLGPAYQRYLNHSQANYRPIQKDQSSRFETWIVEDSKIDVYSEANYSSKLITHLYRGDRVDVAQRYSRWLKISKPVEGFVLGRGLSPQ